MYKCTETTPNRQQRELEARRGAILDAARRVIVNRGIEHTTMEEIARAADYTRRTVYSYFRNRDEVLLKILVQDLEARRHDQQLAMEEEETGLGKLLAWGRAFFDSLKRNPHSLQVQLYWDFRGLDPGRVSEVAFTEFEALNDNLASDLRGAFILGMDDGSLRPDLEEDLAISLYLYSLRAILNRALSTGYSFVNIEPEQYVECFFDLLVHGIGWPAGQAVG
jgi:AcrR family transcriptional regulator